MLCFSVRGPDPERAAHVSSISLYVEPSVVAGEDNFCTRISDKFGKGYFSRIRAENRETAHRPDIDRLLYSRYVNTQIHRYADT